MGLRRSTSGARPVVCWRMLGSPAPGGTTTLVGKLRWRRARRRATPLPSGSIRSRIMQSGGDASSSRIASASVTATATSQPRWLRIARSAPYVAGSSSTIRTVGLGVAGDDAVGGEVGSLAAGIGVVADAVAAASSMDEGSVESKGESASGARLADERELSTEVPRQPPRDGKPQTESFTAIAGIVVGLEELLEQPLLVLRRNADAGVGDGDLDVAARGAGRAHEHPHFALARELDRVADQVLEDALDLHAVGAGDDRVAIAGTPCGRRRRRHGSLQEQAGALGGR